MYIIQLNIDKFIDRIIVLAPTLILLSSCKAGVLDPQGPIGMAERTMLYDATVIMLIIIVPTILLTLSFAWWFRASNKRATYLPDWQYSGRLEVLVWSIPTLVIIFLGGAAWIGSHDLDPSRPIASVNQPLDIQVISLDWKWLFIYPAEGVASVNRLVIPVGTPVRFSLTSASVMNSFFVPQLGSQIYTMAGMTTQLNLQADKAGTFTGLSAQFSGVGFSDMHFVVDAVPVEQYRGWLDSVKKISNELDVQVFKALARPSQANPTISYASVMPDLFKIVSTGLTENRF